MVIYCEVFITVYMVINCEVFITGYGIMYCVMSLLQQSSGVFNYLKSTIPSVTSDPTFDLNSDTLSALGALMLAQGQDCFVRKAMNGLFLRVLFGVNCRKS